MTSFGPRELVDALDRAHQQQADLSLIVDRLEALRALDAQLSRNGAR